MVELVSIFPNLDTRQCVHCTKSHKIAANETDFVLSPESKAIIEDSAKNSAKIGGWVYILTFNSPRAECDKTLFKVGKTQHLGKRIKEMGQKNKETYKYVWKKQTLYKDDVEACIKQHLKNWNEPRKMTKTKPDNTEHEVTLDGGTEWFRGRKEILIEVSDVIFNKINAIGDIEYLWSILKRQNPDLPENILRSSVTRNQ